MIFKKCLKVGIISNALLSSFLQVPPSIYRLVADSQGNKSKKPHACKRAPSLYKASTLISLGCYTLIPKTGGLKWQTLFSQFSEGQVVQDQGADRLSGVWEEPSSWCADGSLLLVSSHDVETEPSGLSSSFYKSMNPPWGLHPHDST